jgi:hypothetical protein
MAYEKDARTAFASKALELSEMFMIKFGRTRFSGNVPRVVKVQAPEESTGGGAQAREPIALIPEGGSGGTIVVGWINVGANRAELRAYHVLAELHRRRYNENLDIPKHEYDQFLEDARSFFAEEDIPSRIVDEVPDAAPLKSAPEAGGGAVASSGGGMSGTAVMLMAVAAVVIGLAIGYILFAPK